MATHGDAWTPQELGLTDLSPGGSQDLAGREGSSFLLLWSEAQTTLLMPRALTGNGGGLVGTRPPWRAGGHHGAEDGDPIGKCRPHPALGSSWELRRHRLAFARVPFAPRPEPPPGSPWLHRGRRPGPVPEPSAGRTPRPAAAPAPAPAPAPARSASRMPPAWPAPRSGSPGG